MDRPLDLIERLKRLSDRELVVEFERQTAATAWAIQAEMSRRWLRSVRGEPA